MAFIRLTNKSKTFFEIDSIILITGRPRIWYLVLPSFWKKIFEGSTRYQMQLQNFSRRKIRYLDRYKYPKKTFLNYFDFWGSLYRYLKWKIKFLFLKYSKFTFSIGTLPQKNHFFEFGTGTKTPKNSRKKYKKRFFWQFIPILNPLFLRR